MEQKNSKKNDYKENQRTFAYLTDEARYVNLAEGLRLGSKTRKAVMGCLLFEALANTGDYATLEHVALSAEDISLRIGVVEEAVMETLGMLEDEGYIEIERNEPEWPRSPEWKSSLNFCTICMWVFEDVDRWLVNEFKKTQEAIGRADAAIGVLEEEKTKTEHDQVNVEESKRRADAFDMALETVRSERDMLKKKYDMFRWYERESGMLINKLNYGVWEERER